MANARKVPEGIEIWRVHLDDEDLRRKLRDVRLSPDETGRAAKFVRERDRERFTVGRLALRQVLSEYARVSPGALEFQYSKAGKPSLKAPSTLLNFNLTHCEDLMVIAVTSMETVGIDTEQVRNDSEHLKIAERFFAPREVEALRSLPSAEQPHAFFLCWTRKEALIKATGSGMSTPLDSFEVSLLPREDARFLSGASGWSLHSFVPMEGFVAAVVAPGTGWNIEHLFL